MTTLDKTDPPPAGTDSEALFQEWEAQEAETDLSDLRLVDIIPFVFFWALFGVVFLQFFTRYALNSSYGWTEEIARYLLIAVTFTGSVMAMRKGSHIAVEAFLILSPARVRRFLGGIIEAAVMLFCALMTWSAAKLSLRAPGYMVSIDIPKAYVYWLVTATFAGMTLYAALRLRRRVLGQDPNPPGPHLVLD